MKTKKQDHTVFVLFLFITIFFSYLVFQKKGGFFWSGLYHWLVWIGLIIGFIFIIFKKKEQLRGLTRYFRYPAFFIFLPFAIFPAMRCYFRIPYIFCRACPNPCPWGQLRPAIIPMLLLQNLDNRFWCFNLCPFGTLQDYQQKMCLKRITPPRWLKTMRYLFLTFTIVVYLLLLSLVGTSWIKNSWFFRGAYLSSLAALGIVLILFILAFFIPRFWCNYLCPIGCFGNLMLKAENKVLSK